MTGSLLSKYKTSLKKLVRTNALAYFASASVTKKKRFITSTPEYVDSIKWYKDNLVSTL